MAKQKKSEKKLSKNSKIILFTVLGVVVLTAVISTLAWYFNTRSGNNDTAQTTSPTPIQTNAADKDMTIENQTDAYPYLNPLTGEPCEESLLTKRPIAVMINNIYAAWPQYNTAKADLLYECEVEGGATRLMAVYSDVSGIDDSIGSVRSSREYYLDFAANHDAIYVHAGGSDEAYNQLAARHVDHLDGVNGGIEGKYYVRDPRRSYMSYEHQLCITGPDILAAVQAKELRTDLNADFQNPLKFAAYTTRVSPTGGEATYVSTPFGAACANFEYDTASKKYLRYEYGTAQMDGLNDVQLRFDNVLVLFCDYSYTGDAKGHISVNDTGSGTGYFISDGKYETIQWSKAATDTPFTLTGENGTALVLNTGKTAIAMVNKDRKDGVTLTK